MTRIGPRGESGERARGAVIVAQSCEAVPPVAEEPVSVSWGAPTASSARSPTRPPLTPSRSRR